MYSTQVLINSLFSLLSFLQTDHQRLVARQDEILERLKSLKELVRAMGSEMGETQGMVRSVARKTGVDLEEVDEDDL